MYSRSRFPIIRIFILLKYFMDAIFIALLFLSSSSFQSFSNSHRLPLPSSTRSLLSPKAKKTNWVKKRCWCNIYILNMIKGRRINSRQYLTCFILWADDQGAKHSPPEGVRQCACAGIIGAGGACRRRQQRLSPRDPLRRPSRS